MKQIEKKVSLKKEVRRLMIEETMSQQDITISRMIAQMAEENERKQTRKSS